MIRFASDTLDSLARMAGFGVFIERDAPGFGFLAFAQAPHAQDWEVWGMGLHVVVSRLRVPHRAG